MNSWSIRRKRIILSIVLLTLVVLIGAPVFFLFYRAPTCSDLKQNGDETGIDCGGSCQLLCSVESLPLISRADPRVLKIADNTFEIVALLENPNNSGEIYRAGYTLKLYDTTNIIPIKVIEGETYVPPASTFAVFEGPFKLGEGIVPARVTLEWKEGTLVWQKSTKRKSELVAKDLVLSREETSPRLNANVENLSLENISNIELTALVSNDAGNIFAASKSFIDILPIKGEVPVVFTWPKPFVEKALDTSILIRILPDTSFIR